MSISRRSTTGCSLCKAKRKKCDETKPRCLRCLASGSPCAYEYMESPESDRHRVRRTRPGPRTVGTRAQNSPAGSTDRNIVSLSPPTISEGSTLFAHSALFETWTDTNSNSIPYWGAVDPYISPVTSQLLADSNPSSTSLDSISPPFDMTSAASNSISQEMTILWDEESDHDPEGVQLLLCPAPTLDKNARDNALPFVLCCYSQWALVKVFEPLKLVHTMREQVNAQFSSEATRTRTILIANVMDMFAKNLAIDQTRKSILTHLVLDVQQNEVGFLATPPSLVPGLDRQSAMHTLDTMLEVRVHVTQEIDSLTNQARQIFSLQIATQSIDTCLQSMDYAAPVFRRACSEAPGQPVNLANIVLQSDLNLRHFATVDIIQSVTTGLPTYIQYEVPFSLELCEIIYQVQDTIGLQWLHGFPDQFILLFAWIISLREIPGAGHNIELVTWIETNLPRIRIAVDESGDPLLRIGRTVVQECWRFAVLIYLYMFLCEVDAHDPRVIRAQKGFMRLVRGVKPGRNPDAYLFTPMIIAGVATTTTQDQDTLRQRIFGVRECAERGTVGNDVMLELEDVWARTRDEGRPAVWSDLRVACFRVTGRH
ncbi:unnamed protein product [Rhizoctonia solani]|uniref:Zn(2)-C6 fungal-type domain-containing protein n=1 Tax=Rhizoctonia solani TaxID=456999 RepID=A0A8H3CX14_9AGAM|nr:unnamed protein product [Rhizoctonia solani]